MFCWWSWCASLWVQRNSIKQAGDGCVREGRRTRDWLTRGKNLREYVEKIAYEGVRPDYLMIEESQDDDVTESQLDDDNEFLRTLNLKVDDSEIPLPALTPERESTDVRTRVENLFRRHTAELRSLKRSANLRAIPQERED